MDCSDYLDRYFLSQGGVKDGSGSGGGGGGGGGEGSMCLGHRAVSSSLNMSLDAIRKER